MNDVTSFSCLILLLYFAFKLARKQFDFSYESLSKYRNCLFGISTIFIALFHIFNYTAPLTNDVIVNQTILFCSTHLNIGVDVFLVLSGVGLYYSFSRKSSSFFDYYKKRVLNVYLITLIIDFPYVLFIHFAKNESFGHSFAKWTGLLNLTGETRLAWYSVFVMILYLFYPLLFRIQKRSEEQNRDILLVSTICLAWVAVCYTLKNLLGQNTFNTIEIAICRIPVFVAGSLLGRFSIEQKKSTFLTYIFSVFFIAAFVLLNANYSLINLRFAHSIILLPVIIILVSAFKICERYSPYTIRILEFFGKISLEYYLVHMAFFYANMKTVNNGPLYLVFALVAVLPAYMFNRLKLIIIDKVKHKEINKHV